MAVIINEFEVVPDTGESETESQAETTPSSEQSRPLTPADIADVFRYQMDRMLRIWAD